MVRSSVTWSVVALTLLITLIAGCQAQAGSPLSAAGSSAPQATTAPQNSSAPQQTSGSQQKGKAPVIKQYSAPPPMTIDPNKSYSATLHTTMGDIHIGLLPKDAPVTVNNFVFLSRDGFYDNVKFHRIVKGFMIQTGDPTGTGAGGPGYKFNDEPVTRSYTRGTVAMANAGPNTNGSQFFIMQADYALPKAYTIFGLVTDQASLGVVDKIASVPVRPGPSGEVSVPNVDVRITSVDITEK